MGLSDELLGRRETLAALREILQRLLDETGAKAAFLVDEEGSPFAATGHIEFELPHPVARLVGEGASDALLGALVGESPDPSSGLLVKPAGPRALVALVHPAPSKRQEKRLAEAARELAALL